MNRKANKTLNEMKTLYFAELRQKGWGEWKEEDISTYRGAAPVPTGVKRFFHNNLYSVQVYLPQTDWGQIVHLVLRRNDEKPGISWADKQRVKDELVGEDRVAVEVFPPKRQLVDDAHLYHLWVLPEGLELPFGLHLPGWSK